MTASGAAHAVKQVHQTESWFHAGDMIFVSLENWDEVWRRNQFLCAALTRRFPRMKILFVGLPRNVSHDLRHGKVGAWREKATWTVPGYPNITVTHALKLLPDTITVGRRFNEWMTRRQIRSLVNALGIKDSLLWLNPHSAVHMAGRIKARATIYDITDDWAMAPSFSDAERNRIVEQDRELCRRADLVIVCSEALEASRQGRCKRLQLLPNGVDSAHYAAIPDRTQNGAHPRPVFGYTGTIHADRFDVELVINLARAFAHGSVVLVGPDHLTPAEKARLAWPGNIHMTGPVAYAQIPEVMAQFDVCIVPHVESKFTNSLNPLKLWEYLASGKPIVSTAVAGFRSFPHLCRIATGPEAFVRECGRALEEDGAKINERRAEAQKHSWDHRCDRLLEALAALEIP